MRVSGNRIRKVRKAHNMSQKELAETLGYKTYTTISKWEANLSMPPSNELIKLAELFNVSTDYLLGVENYSTDSDFHPNINTVEVEYVDSYDPDLLYSSTPERTIRVPRNILGKAASSYFVLKVHTDSMNRLIPNDSNVIVLDYRKHSNPPLKTGDIIVTKTDNEHFIYYLRITDAIYYLEAFSFYDGYKDKQYTEEEFEKIEVIGKVVYSFYLFG